ncbi:hypothetical protein GH733_005938 [Mirounga leonina]|nr:hypothetical protein GH733_005938 [Mirounga leonina]
MELKQEEKNHGVHEDNDFGSSVNCEGGWDADGKGPSVWDTFTHQGGERVFKNQTGDVAGGSYTLWEEGIDCYNKIIDDLLTNGVTPIATLYHYDLPQALEDKGGWLSEAIIESFDKYARFCFGTFGDPVQRWITINEPNVFALLAYDFGIYPAGVPHFGTGTHARSWHSYDSLFRKEQKGVVSLAIFATWVEPADPNSVSDQGAAKRALAFCLNFFAKPVFTDGDYPEVVKSQIAFMSKKQGYPSSRFPEFTEEEKRMIKGTAGFFAVQYYTTHLDVEIQVFPDPTWITSLDWIYVVPWGICEVLQYIKDTYNNPVIYITENGFPQGDPASLDDTQLWEYFRHFRNCSKIPFEMMKDQLCKLNIIFPCAYHRDNHVTEDQRQGQVIPYGSVIVQNTSLKLLLCRHVYSTDSYQTSSANSAICYWRRQAVQGDIYVFALAALEADNSVYIALMRNQRPLQLKMELDLEGKKGSVVSPFGVASWNCKQLAVKNGHQCFGLEVQLLGQVPWGSSKFSNSRGKAATYKGFPLRTRHLMAYRVLVLLRLMEAQSPSVRSTVAAPTRQH